MPKLNQSDTSKYNIEQGEVRNTTNGFWSQLGGLLSFSGIQDTYQPGEAISLEVTAETEETYNTEDAIKTVTIYKCADSTCETPPPIDDPSEDQCSNEEWWPDYDDCIAKNTDTVWFSATQDPGTSWTWDVEFSGLEDEATYILVGYVQTENQGIVTDVSKQKFTVESDSSTSDPEPQLVTYKTPSYTVNDDGSVTGTIGIRNKGDGGMESSDIVEMQVRPAGSNPLSFTSDTTDVCDTDYPENVHKDYRIDANDEQNIRLETGPVLKDGNSYSVYFLTREGCGGAKTPPIYNSYNAGTFTYQSGDSGGGDDDGASKTPDVVQYGKPSVKYQGGKVTTTVYFKNKGGDMQEKHIVEAQVRPQGKNPLSVLGPSLSMVSPTSKTCDSRYPENRYKTFQLSSGETAKISISTSAVEPGKKYWVYALTRSECAPGNERVAPYENSKFVGVVDTGDDTVNPPIGLPLVPVSIGLLVTGVLGYVVIRSE